MQWFLFIEKIEVQNTFRWHQVFDFMTRPELLEIIVSYLVRVNFKDKIPFKVAM